MVCVILSGLPRKFGPAYASEPYQNSGNSCTGVVPNGSTVLDSSTIVWPDASRHHRGPSCANELPPTINGWIEDAWQSIGTQWVSVEDQWTVPSPPTNQNGAWGGNVICLFDAIQDTTPRIFQPVLGWGCFAANGLGCTQGGGFWWMAAFVASTSNIISFTSPVRVSSGDLIDGKVSWISNCNLSDYRAPPGYVVTITDQTIGQTSQVTGCSTFTGATSAFTGVLETYNINTCDQLPASGIEIFYNVISYPGQSSWNTNIGGGTPFCSYGAWVGNAGITYLCWHSGYCNSGSDGSVATGTLITLEDRRSVPVQNLHVGMQLLAFNTSTSQYSIATITKLVTVQTNNMLIIKTQDPLPLRTDNATVQELWIKQPDGSTGWLSVTKLRVGDYLFNAIRRNWTLVTSLTYVPGSFTMYDLYTTSPFNYVANNYLDPVKTPTGV